MIYEKKPNFWKSPSKQCLYCQGCDVFARVAFCGAVRWMLPMQPQHYSDKKYHKKKRKSTTTITLCKKNLFTKLLLNEKSLEKHTNAVVIHTNICLHTIHMYVGTCKNTKVWKPEHTCTIMQHLICVFMLLSLYRVFGSTINQTVVFGLCSKKLVAFCYTCPVCYCCCCCCCRETNLHCGNYYRKATKLRTHTCRQIQTHLEHGDTHIKNHLRIQYTHK